MEVGMELPNPRPRRRKWKRALMLPRRYGVTPKRFIGNLADMVAVLRKNDAVGTFPVTAIVLDRHPAIAKILDGMEVAVHGLNHREFPVMGRSQQESAMRAARELLTGHKFHPVGFRAPYLRWSENTLDAAAAAGFLYDSSIPARWSCGGRLDSTAGMREALETYGVSEVGTSLPFKKGTLIEMPVALPDDEILIDRLGITSSNQLKEAFTAMTESAAISGGHIVLQFHPERFHLFRNALDDLIAKARNEDAWIAPLKDVAEWWLKAGEGQKKWPEGHSFALTVSGDIDAVTLIDFILRGMGR